MRSRRVIVLAVVAASAACALLGACASNEEAGGPSPSRPDTVPMQDAAPDAATDATDAAPCPDCEEFPAVCTPDVLCPNGPFESPDPALNLDPRTEILVIRGRGPNDVWAAGAIGAVAHFDGASWTRSDLGAPDTQRALWLRSSGEVAFGTLTGIYTRGLDFDGDADASLSPGGWSFHPSPPQPPSFSPMDQSLRSAWAAPDSDALWIGTLGAFGGSGLWRLRCTPPTPLELAEGIPADVCRDLRCGEILGIHGASPSAVWAVGGGGATIHILDANSEAPKAKAFNSLTTRALRGVWAASDTDVWAVGATGTIRRYRGDPMFWEVVDGVPTTKSLNAVWGTSASDVWAVGDAAVVLHYDGHSWSRVKVAGLGAHRPDLSAVWSPAPGHVWVGGKGVILSLGGKP